MNLAFLHVQCCMKLRALSIVFFLVVSAEYCNDMKQSLLSGSHDISAVLQVLSYVQKKRVKKVKERARMKRTQRFPRPQSEEQKLRIAGEVRVHNWFVLTR